MCHQTQWKSFFRWTYVVTMLLVILTILSNCLIPNLTGTCSLIRNCSLIHSPMFIKVSCRKSILIMKVLSFCFPSVSFIIPFAISSLDKDLLPSILPISLLVWIMSEGNSHSHWGWCSLNFSQDERWIIF